MSKGLASGWVFLKSDRSVISFELVKIAVSGKINRIMDGPSIRLELLKVCCLGAEHYTGCFLLFKCSNEILLSNFN